MRKVDQQVSIIIYKKLAICIIHWHLNVLYTHCIVSIQYTCRHPYVLQMTWFLFHTFLINVTDCTVHSLQWGINFINIYPTVYNLSHHRGLR